MSDFCQTLDFIYEEIIIINKNYEICYWNNNMKAITNLDFEEVESKNILEVLPNLNTNYFKKTANDLFANGNKAFLSAAMHKNLISEYMDFNLYLSIINKGKSKYLLMEFVDVTSQFMQINKLKKYTNELYKLNLELKEKEIMIKKLAYYDNLTGISNRSLFYKLAEKMFESAKRNNNKMCLMFIDIDNFKCINDNYGHDAGDKAIVKVAEILKEATRENDIVARYGGDEFIVLLTQIKSHDDYKIVVSRIVNNKDNVLILCREKVEITMSIGISFYPNDGETIDKLLTKADKEMYIKKGQKKSHFVVKNFKKF